MTTRDPRPNITIAGNIYPRVSEELPDDPEFVGRVVGRSALEKIKKQFSDSFSGVKLTPAQERMYREDVGCSYAKSGEMPYGLVLREGALVWEGRCEYSACAQYKDESCPGIARFKRPRPKRAGTPEEPPPLAYRWLGAIPEEELFTPLDGREPERVPPEAVVTDLGAAAARGGFVAIQDPAPIVEAPIDSRILVNAAPGSGKTHTAIRRLEYMIRSRMAKHFANVLVLVYTNAAGDEIRGRLKAGVREGTLPPAAQEADVRTLDSFASSYLASIGACFAHLNYNERIRLFNERLNPDDLARLEYVIVDELQDLVNERAKMTLKILAALRGGCLLLGDCCQAIFDYDCHEGETVKSDTFYEKLLALLPDDAQKYELTGNHRQAGEAELTGRSDRMRRALLGPGPREANRLVAEELSRIPLLGGVERFDFGSLAERAAILCRNNGEAAYVSHILNGKGVRHALLRGAGPLSLNRFIADCLWDYRASPGIARDEFAEKYRARVSDDEAAAHEAYDALSETACGGVEEYVELDRLAERLASLSARPRSDLSPLLLSDGAAALTVSTIHRAKGREFDAVYLLDGGFRPGRQRNLEEARVWYVACTRARRGLYRLKRGRNLLRPSMKDRARWVQLKGGASKWWGRSAPPPGCCERVVLGLPADLSDAGFVRGDLAEALRAQRHVAEAVRVGDPLRVVLEEGRYRLFHGESAIGCLGADMPERLRALAGEGGAAQAPPSLSPVYVSNVVTIAPRQFPNEIPPYFRASRFWLGIELSGFPEIDWGSS